MEERCKHDLLHGECGYCVEPSPDLPPHVYITTGGDAYHIRRDCFELTDGQRWVESRGGEPGPILRVTIRHARDAGREPCGGCVASLSTSIRMPALTSANPFFPGGRFPIEGPHLDALEDAMLGPTIQSSADELRIYLEAYLGELAHRDALDTDDQGNFVVESEGAHIFAGVVDGTPATAWIGAPLLWNVDESLELLQAINQMNVEAEAGRVIWNGSQVVIEDQFPSYVLNIQDLSNAFDRIVGMAGKYGPALFERFSGTTSSSGVAPDSPDRLGYL